MKDFFRDILIDVELVFIIFFVWIFYLVCKLFGINIDEDF